MERDDSTPRTMLGALIRQQRTLADLSMRQLSSAVGISNPYLSQIEHGLRMPSDQVLNAIATSLQTTAEALNEAAGFRPESPHRVASRDQAETADDAGLAAAIAAASELTAQQRRALTEIYRSFVDANAARRGSRN